MIGTNTIPSFNAASSEAAGTVAATAPAPTQSTITKNSTTDIHVTLSATGRSLAASKPSEGKNADIDQSNLPDTIKETLKRIRELRAELEKKQQELHQVMADQSLTPEQRQTRILGLQTEIGALAAAITSASTSMLKQINDLKLSPDQKIAAGQLMMA